MLTLTGVRVAYPLEYRGNPGRDMFEMAIKRLTDGKRLLDEPNGTIQPTACCNNAATVGYGPTQSVALAARGDVAWVAQEDVLYGDVPNGELLTNELRVYAHDAAGDHLLDTSTGVDPGSLRWRGNTVSWTDSGQTDSATVG